jgi:Ca-activated chloride channel family protein
MIVFAPHRRIVSMLLLMAATVLTLFGQDKPGIKDEDVVVRIDTQLIDVPLTVTDQAGKPILNLKQSNFVVYEDGKIQEIADFSATSAPFEVALYLDTSGSTRNELVMMRRAAQLFLDLLRPGDRVAIVAFRSVVVGSTSMAEPEVIIGLTSDRSALRNALDRVNTSNGTPYYDGLIRVVETIFKSEPADEFRGRRALVALTDGVDSTSLAGYSEAKETLLDAGIANYFIQVDTRPYFEDNLLGDCSTAIRFSQAQIRRYYASFNPKANLERTSDFCRLGDFERLAISKKLYEIADVEMKELAKSSGGRVFPIADLSDARNAFRLVAGEIGTKYSLGYYSTNENRDGTYRSIRVELQGLPSGTQVRAREGYSAPAR